MQSATNNNNVEKQTYWKNSEEMLGSDTSFRQEFQDGEEFPPSFENGVSRRTFMAMASASLAFAAAACRRPDHKLTPSVQSVEYLVPGIPVHYTTAYQKKNAAYSLLVKTVESRPIKIDGNDRFAISGGASDSRMQAEILSLYDPDRIRRAKVNGGDSSINNALLVIGQTIKSDIDAGRQTRFLVDEHCSPTFSSLQLAIENLFPSVKFVTFSPTSSDNAAIVNKSVLSIDGEIVPNLSKAEVIVSFDSDLLGTDKNAIFHTKQFSKNRRPTATSPVMNKLLVVESVMSLTGSAADKRWAVSPNNIESLLFGVLSALSKKIAVSQDILSAIPNNNTVDPVSQEIADNLLKVKDKALVVVGSHLSISAHSTAVAINLALDSVGEGKAIDTNNVLPNSGTNGENAVRLVEELESGIVGTLVFCDVNPEYSGNAALKKAITKAKNRFCLSVYPTETASICSVEVPAAHFLESWGDALSFDGLLSLQQPLIAPLIEGSMSLQDSLMQICRYCDSASFSQNYYDFLRNRLSTIISSTSEWQSALREGFVSSGRDSSASQPVVPDFTTLSSMISSKKDSYGSVYVQLSYTMSDGGLANNSWLAELPDPITKVTWENVVSLSNNTAEKMGVSQGDLLLISTPSGSVELPAYVQPGMADGVYAVNVGWGRTAGGKVIANNNGDNVYRLFSKGSSVGYLNANIEKTGKSTKVASTQRYNVIESERGVIKEFTLAEIAASKHGASHSIELPLSIVDDVKYLGHRWGMTIDMSSCIGCGACITACQAENNIPTVGKGEVLNGRQMHWMRIDRYYSEPSDGNVEVSYMPMLCQHCENAPCENVCPVAATTHSPEGLNEMTYNRCVGTKYCANNCPFKVRRFNWLNYHTDVRQPLDLVHNPEVTVRMRGVIEKCSFCVQRINSAKYQAKDKGRSRVLDGEVITACQQACPAGSIYFGDVNNKESVVVKERDNSRAYVVLGELNVRPSVTYLGKVRNREQYAAKSASHHS